MDVPIALAATKIEGGKTVRHPTFGLWPVALREDLRSALQDGLRKVVLWTDQHGAETHVFDSGEIDPFFNINTPEDLELANKMMETLHENIWCYRLENSGKTGLMERLITEFTARG